VCNPRLIFKKKKGKSKKRFKHPKKRQVGHSLDGICKIEETANEVGHKHKKLATGLKRDTRNAKKVDGQAKTRR